MTNKDAKTNARDLLNWMKVKNGGFPAVMIHKMNQIYLSLQTVHGVQNETEFATAISNIGSGSGTIWLDSGTFTFSSTLEINGGGSIIIRGNGNSTILKPADGVTLFDVTSATGVKFENFKVDTSNYTSDVAVFDIDEASDNLVFFDNITIAAGSNYGTGILLTSDNCYIQNCNISGVKHGIYITGEDHQIVSNIISGNYNGIYLYTASRNSIMGNYINGNDSNDANTYAAVYISTNSDNNTIRSNYISSNNNAGAGTTYGVYIDAATCEENVIDTNEVTGNDSEFEDEGTETEIVYFVGTGSELQNALNSIGAKAGTIKLKTGTITLTTAINVNGSGDYVIEGGGETSVIDINGDYKAFDITSATSCTLRNFKIDASDLVTSTIEIIDVSEASNNKVFINNVTIVGDGTNGIGIELNSNNCVIELSSVNNVDKGIQVLSQYNNINNNVISSCPTAGIYVNSGEYNVITDNNCSSNTIDGIYLTGSSYNKISRNVLNSNSQNGIYLTGSSNNTISQNTIDGNDSNTANPQAGIYITSNSDNNVISGNNSINNNNSGAGNSYGLYIATATCDDNKFSDNTITGNDIFVLDNGTNTSIIYEITSANDLQNALDSIAAKSGYIKIPIGTITLTTAIDIDGNGDYVIEGGGDGSVIDINGDYKAFNITAANSLVLKSFKIDASDLTTSTIEIIDITEASDNKVTCENITISGDGVNGIGIEINSENVAIKSCDIDSVDKGLQILANNTSAVSKNTFASCATAGIYVNGADYGKISNNKINSNADGIYLTDSDNNVISNNIIRLNTLNGIYLTGSDNNKISGNICDANDSNTANPQAGIYIAGDSDNNTIIANTLTNNNNSGAGNSYGLYIAAATVDRSNVSDNVYSGNDIFILDNGTNTVIIYHVSTATELQNALDSIGSKSGHIYIATGTMALSSTITIDGGGSYIIEGNGDNSIITTGDRIGFNISDIVYLEMKNFKIDSSAFTTDKECIYLRMASEETPVFVCDNLHLVGTSGLGYGIYIHLSYGTWRTIIRNCEVHEFGWGIDQESNIANNVTYCYNNYVYNCDTGGGGTGIVISPTTTSKNFVLNNYVKSCYSGIQVASSSVVLGNIINSCTDWGIQISNADDCIVNNNEMNACGTGLYGFEPNYCVLDGNRFNDCTRYGIYFAVTGADVCEYNIISNCLFNNCCASGYGADTGAIHFEENSNYNKITGNYFSNNTNSGAGTGYGIYLKDNTITYNIFSDNTFKGNDAPFYDNGTGNRGLAKTLSFEEWEPDNEVNVDVRQVYDSTERKIVADVDATGAAASVDLMFQFRIPEDWQGFLGNSDDITVRAIQDAGADVDTTITINFIDNSGTDSDDDSVSATSLTGSYAAYDCAINAGTFLPKDLVFCKVTLSLPDADDAVRVVIPEILYY